MLEPIDGEAEVSLRILDERSRENTYMMRALASSSWAVSLVM